MLYTRYFDEIGTDMFKCNIIQTFLKMFFKYFHTFKRKNVLRTLRKMNTITFQVPNWNT